MSVAKRGKERNRRPCDTKLGVDASAFTFASGFGFRVSLFKVSQQEGCESLRVALGHIHAGKRDRFAGAAQLTP